MGLHLYRIMLEIRMKHGNFVEDGWYFSEIGDEAVEIHIKNNKIVDICMKGD